MESVVERIKTVIANQMSIDIKDVHEWNDFINDLDMDSLDIVETVMGLEEEFNIEIPDEAAAKIGNVQDVIAYISNPEEFLKSRQIENVVTEVPKEEKKPIEVIIKCPHCGEDIKIEVKI